MVKIILKKLKSHNTIWHPESRLVFKSKKEQIVIGRLNEDGEDIEVLENIEELCEPWKFKVCDSLYESGEEEKSEPFKELVNEPANELANEPSKEPVNEPANEPAKELVNEPTNEPSDDEKSIKLKPIVSILEIGDALLSGKKKTKVKEEKKTTTTVKEEKKTKAKDEKKTTAVKEEKKTTKAKDEKKTTTVKEEKKTTKVKEEKKTTKAKEEKKTKPLSTSLDTLLDTVHSLFHDKDDEVQRLKEELVSLSKELADMKESKNKSDAKLAKIREHFT